MRSPSAATPSGLIGPSIRIHTSNMSFDVAPKSMCISNPRYSTVRCKKPSGCQHRRKAGKLMVRTSFSAITIGHTPPASLAAASRVRFTSERSYCFSLTHKNSSSVTTETWGLLPMPAWMSSVHLDESSVHPADRLARAFFAWSTRTGLRACWQVLRAPTLKGCRKTAHVSPALSPAERGLFSVRAADLPGQIRGGTNLAADDRHLRTLRARVRVAGIQRHQS